MMKLSEIKNKAAKEDIDISKELGLIESTLKSSPDGSDINIPIEKLDAVILYCDNNNIPVYNIAENCLSIAHSYTQLLARERSR